MDKVNWGTEVHVLGWNHAVLSKAYFKKHEVLHLEIIVDENQVSNYNHVVTS